MDQILNSLNLDTNFQKFKYAELKPYLMNDKKVSSGKLNLILLNSGLTGYKTDKFDPSNFSKAFKLSSAALDLVAFNKSWMLSAAGETSQK